jgi:hypothetical protein
VVKALRYKPEGRGIDSRWCHNPSGRTIALGSTQPLTEMSARNVSWGKGGRCVGLTTLPPSWADCHEIWEPQPAGTLRACNGIALPLPYTSLYSFCFIYLLSRVHFQIYCTTSLRIHNGSLHSTVQYQSSEKSNISFRLTEGNTEPSSLAS